jgi:ATP-dependent RNA helicase DDX31/DBP7
LKKYPFIVAGCLFGGEETNHEKSRLRKGTSILFCTPGRVLYHMEHTQSFKLTNLQSLVFEEADRTLDMGFQETVHKILNILKDKIELNHVQKVLVSAHFNSKVSNLLE